MRPVHLVPTVSAAVAVGSVDAVEVVAAAVADGDSCSIEDLAGDG